MKGRRSRRGSGKLTAMVLLVLAGTGGLLYVAYRAAGTAAQVQKQEAKKPEKKGGPMTDAERLEYVKSFVEVSNLEIGPDMKPDVDEPVPGLFRVTGLVSNKGERKVDRVNLAVYPKDEAGKVLGSYIENVAGVRGLEPGASRQFKFTIPEKKEYGGAFDHKVK